MLRRESMNSDGGCSIVKVHEGLLYIHQIIRWQKRKRLEKYPLTLYLF